MSACKKRIVILGGGFAGVYAAKALHKELRSPGVEIILINRDNYMTFHPMLAEVLGNSLGVYDSVRALSSLLPKTTLYINEIEQILFQKKEVLLRSEFKNQYVSIPYDELILALGTGTDFSQFQNGVAQHALRFKGLSDTFVLRNHVIEVIEAATTETDPQLREALLTFVIGGGGFTGTEIAGELMDFLKKLIKKRPSIKPEEIKLILIHSKDVILNELSDSLGRYAMHILRKKGVILALGQKLEGATPYHAILANGEKIATRTIIATAPSNPHPLIFNSDLPLEGGRIKTNGFFQVDGFDHVWAIGDAASIPLADGGFAPPTAQFAIREARFLAKNIHSLFQGKKMVAFNYKPLGMLATLGHHSAVAEFFGICKISGFFAWIIWRAIYWLKMPGLGRKLKVLLTWMLDMLMPHEPIALRVHQHRSMLHLHFKEDEVIFEEGDLPEFLYIIVEGSIGIFKEGCKEVVTILEKGSYFGEIALVNDSRRTAKAVALQATDLIAIPKEEFLVIKNNFKDLDQFVKKVEKERLFELNKKSQKEAPLLQREGEKA